jgi:DNA-binding NtrC family response regulator
MNILLIDDEPDILDIMKEYILQTPGRNCLLAENVGSAEALLPQADIIISDIAMPNSSRLEALLSKANKPVGRITGHSTSDELILNKPFSLQELESLILKLKEQMK